MRKIVLQFFTSILFLLLSSNNTQAAFLSLESSTFEPIDPEQTITVAVNIDTEAASVTQGHAYLTFNPQILEFVDVTHGSFFPLVLFKYFANKKALDLVGTIEPNQALKTGSGQLASISFKGKAAGTTTLAFNCVPGQKTDLTNPDSDILDYNPADPLNPNDIIDCGKTKLSDVSFTVTGSGPQTPPPYTSPVAGTPTCDICGHCQGGEKPPDWQKCMDCYARPSHTWTVLGCVPNTAAGFGQILLSFIVGIAAGTAFIAFLYGAFLILTAKGDPQQLDKGKNLAVSSLIGLFIILFAVFILNLVGVQILKIPGFG